MARNLGKREPVQIFAAQSVTESAITLYTNDQRIPHYRIAVRDIILGRDDRIMEHHLNHYIKNIIIGQGYATKEEIDVRLPNLFRYPAQFERERHQEEEKKRLVALQLAAAEQERKRKASEESYDVNMVECLVGWKTWKWDKVKKLLCSPTYHMLWNPDEAIRAKCTHEIMTSACSCGIYAADDKQAISSYGGTIYGRVHGWGRYIRGDKGWRAEFAYPREFYLNADQADFIDKLRIYHVPIYISQPLRVYDPMEDGYDGHWNTEENGNSGADEITDSEED